jgi:hypothetical protein
VTLLSPSLWSLISAQIAEQEEARATHASSQERLGQELLGLISQQTTGSLREERTLVPAKSLEELSLFSTMEAPARDPADTRGVAVSEVRSLCLFLQS